MSPSEKKNSDVLARVNFPLYTIELLTCRHVVVAGGGGAAKTGVANGFEVFELMFDGDKFISKEVLRHETGRNVVMNFAVYSNSKRTYLATGQEAHCQLYSVRCEVLKENITVLPDNEYEKKQEELELRNRNYRNNKFFSLKKNNQKVNGDEEVNKETLKFSFHAADCIQTDFNTEEPFQRVVRISRKGNIVVTGGADGYIRLWKFPSFQKLLDIKAHKNEIDDIHISIDENQVISISKDESIIWDTHTGSKIHNMQWKPSNDIKYIYKKCRFAQVDSEPEKSNLFVLCNPVGRPNKYTSFLQLWNPIKGTLMKQTRNNESLSALAVRNDGRFVAVGTMYSGSVIVYIAFSLRKVLVVPEVHSTFVTGLEFLQPPDDEDNCITSTSEFAVLSISIDNKICINYLPHRNELPVWIVGCLMVISIFFAFLFCDYMGL